MRHDRLCAGWPRVAALVACLGVAVSAQPPSGGTWLDRPLASWNAPGAPIPSPPAVDEDKAAVVKRCELKRPAATPQEKAVDAAGWITFWNLDQQLVRDGIEIVGGMAGADGMCRPVDYNLFVFVDGRFDRSSAGPVVIPVDVRTTRGQ